MICDYLNHPTSDKSKRWDRSGPIAGCVSSLLKVLRDQLLTHQFREALHTMEGVVMAYDKIPDIARKAGVEVLLHDHSHYGEALQLFKHLFGKQLKHREEILLDLSLFIAQHGNIEEAFETLHSQISTEPYNSNPLLRGYCGVFQYMLWEREVSRQQEMKDTTAKPKADSMDSDLSSSDSEDGQTDSLLARVYSKRSLTHFDTLWTMTLSQDDNLDYFLHTHYKQLVALDMKKQAIELLQMYDEKFPQRIAVKRLLCGHLREHSSAKVNRRRRYLKALVELDESCIEVLELVQLMLEKDKVDYSTCHELLLCYLDYPSNGSDQLAWDLLRRVQLSWPESAESRAWLSRLPLWRELYATSMQHCSSSNS